MTSHRATNIRPGLPAGALSYLRQLRLTRAVERRVWAVALVLAAIFSGGALAVAAATGDQVACEPGASLEVKPGGTWSCMAAPTASPSATQTPEPTPSTSTTAGPTVAPTTSTPGGTTPPATTTTTTPAPTSATPGPTATVPGSWPDASTTGPTGPLAARPCSGAITLGSGAVLQDVAITGGCDINVVGTNVVIRNVSMAVANNDGWAIIVRNGASATISDVEVFGLDKTTKSVQYAVLAQPNATVVIQRADFHHCADCVQGEHVTLVDSYLHDLANIEGVSHVDGFQCNGSCSGTVIRHNRIDMTGLGQTGTVSLFQDFGVPSNVLVEGNWLSGGGFTVYGGGGNASSRKGTPTNIRVVNNRIDSGQYGWLTEWNGAGAGNVLSGNYLSNGTPL